jgi:hypothetical protein
VLESISIDDGEGARDNLRREDNFPLNDPAILCMRLVLDGLSLDMMIVRRESCGGFRAVFALPTVNSSAHDARSIFTLQTKHREACLTLTRIDTFEYWFVNYATWILQ